MKQFTRACLAITISVFLTACNSVGPQRLNGERQDYNEAVSNSSNQQLLLNIIRLHNGAPPSFLEISNISTQNSLQAKADLGLSHVTGWDAADSSMVSPGVTFTEMPTISYAPLQGAAFANQMLEPISLQYIYFLLRSGWPIDQIFSLTLEDINNQSNVLESSPLSYQKNHQTFEHILKDFRALQQQNALRFYYAASNQIPTIMINIAPSSQKATAWQDLAKSLHFNPNTKQITMSEYYPGHKGGEIFVETRSMLGVLIYLSNAVPQINGDGFDNADKYATVQHWLKIQTTATPPRGYYLSVQYQQHWYYLANHDINSKMTMLALFELFQLATGENIQNTSPMLTLPLR